MKKQILRRLQNVKLLIMDVDGILTNGEIKIDGNGKEIKVFDVQDGFGLVAFQRAGFKTAIISARSAKAVSVRAKDIGITKVYQDAHPKTDAYEQLLKIFKLKDQDVCFMGDDLPDMGVLNRVGLAVSVPNGVREVKKIAHYVTKNPGGKGAVREVVELILKSQGKWNQVLRKFSK